MGEHSSFPVHAQVPMPYSDDDLLLLSVSAETISASMRIVQRALKLPRWHAIQVNHYWTASSAPEVEGKREASLSTFHYRVSAWTF